MSVLLISTGFAALLYLVSGIAIMSAMKKGAEAKASSLLRWPVLLGLVLHGYAVGQEMFTAEAVHFGFGYAVSVMFFFAVVTLLIESWVHRIHALFGIILIAAAFGALFPVFFQGQVVPAADWTLAFRWHLVFALAAYSFMMIAFVQAVLMMLQNTRLRAKGLSANDDLLDSLPGLVVMERVFYRIVATGFFCLTLVLILGAVVTKELQGVYFLFDPSTSFSTTKQSSPGFLGWCSVFCSSAVRFGAGAPRRPCVFSGRDLLSLRLPILSTASFLKCFEAFR